MLPQELLDTAIVLLGFLVRIAVPIAITLALGYWLEKKLSPAEEKDEVAQVKRSTVKNPKIIQLHCWDLKRCPSTQRAACAACQHPDLPCWLALQVAGEEVREQCFTCALYKPQTQVA